MAVSAVLSRRLLGRGMPRGLVVPVSHLHATASLRAYEFDAGGLTGSTTGSWPRSLMNTVLCVCPQGEKMIVERFGKLARIQDPGLFFAIPLVDRIAYCVDMRETAYEIHPQATITKDNVTVRVSGTIYVQFVDAEKAAYGSSNPIYAVTQFAQSTMRAAIGDMELDEILNDRQRLNHIIQATVQEGSSRWGLDVLRYEITEVTPDKHILEAMEKQAAAERLRREKVLIAEGNKRQVELESEAQKVKLINESEGNLIKVSNEAEAERSRLKLEAEGEAESILSRAQAQAESIRMIAHVLEEGKGSEAAQLALAREYAAIYAKMGQTSNTMLFQDRPADVNSLMAQAAAVLKLDSSAGKK